MERKIGEIFEYNDEFFQCVESSGCALCAFNETDCNDIDTGSCEVNSRSDRKSVVFKRLEKVGEPFSTNILENKVWEQRYRLYDPMAILNGYWYHIDGYFIDIEIKQNKEDMEENNNAKHSNSENIGKNLKPFNLEAAKSGKPVCTRDGRKAIFLTTLSNKNFPVVAIVSCGQEENIYQYDINGVCDEHDDNLDLMMLPEKKEGWVNVSKFSAYPSKEEALSHKTYDIISTVKVEWYE